MYNDIFSLKVGGLDYNTVHCVVGVVFTLGCLDSSSCDSIVAMLSKLAIVSQRLL